MRQNIWAMSCSWEKRLAENLTNADHMRDVRNRIDIEHEERLRRRERERENAEVRRAARKVKTPTTSVKFNTRSYDRPWAVRKPETRKKSSCSANLSSSDNSSSSSRSSGSWLPDITNRAQKQSSEPTGASGTEKTQHQDKHAANKRSSRDDSLLVHRNKCVRTKTRKPLPSGRLTCSQGVHGQYTPSNTETSPCLSSQNKPPFIHNRRSLHMSQDHHLARAWPHLPSLICSSSSSESSVSQPDFLLDFSDLDSNIPEEKETDNSEGPQSSILSAHSVSTDSCLSSTPRAESTLGYPFSFGSSSCTSPRDTVLSLTPRSRASSLEFLCRDLPALEPITSESDEEDLEQELNSWQTGQFGRDEGVVRWRGSLSQPYPTYPASATSTAATTSYRRDNDESLSQDASPHEARVRRSLDADTYSSMPGLEPIPEVTPTSGSSASTVRNNRAGLFLSFLDHMSSGLPGLEPIPRNEPPWLGRRSRPGASSLQASSQDRDRQSYSSGEGTAGGTPSPASSRIEALAMMDQLGMALMAMWEMQREVQETWRNNGHERGVGQPHRNDMAGGNSTGNEANADHGNSTSSSVDGNTASAPEARQKALCRITQSLMEESEEEEEGDQCRICQSGAVVPTNALLSPCQCSGSLQYIHHDCLKRWIQTKIESGANMTAVTTCELCKGTLKLDLDDFDLEECFRQNAQAQRERNGPDLNLLLLLHERFSGLMTSIQAYSAAVAQDLRQRGELETVTDRAMRRSQGSTTGSTTMGQTSDSDSQSPL